MVGASQQIMRVEVEPGIRLAVEAAGDADKPALLLSSSLAADMTMWDEIVARAADQFRIVRYDARGHGRSDVPAGPYTIEQLGRDALAIMDALDIGRAAFCGLSLGGLTGMWLGATHSERFGALVLANTAASFPPARMWFDRAEQVRASGMQSLADATIERWLTKAYRESHPERSAALRATLEGTPAEGYAACCKVLATTDMQPHLGRINCPVLVICGAHDPSTPPARGEEIMAGIKGATMVTLDAAHISAVEAADAFAAEVKKFVSRITGPVE
ncbi:3-oxoadipate enol-lactonase [Bradyrhizobium semiaridum]|uniref:3-oxoadipate enol-lactonase n=1 Tax=Bradyrhizobium semiaridum TaxID=2821404 RepID=UPI001CE3B507|nr:3-oxoadipate enol-lactonase [Bradyrhizobium semiaridum]